MSTLQQQFRQQWIPYGGRSRVLIACSGGPDSIALMHLLCGVHEPRGALLVGHFNHGLRGRDAENDARFVQEVCDRLQLKCVIGHADTQRLQQLAQGRGIESAARELRYQYLTESAERFSARYLVTGHTSDDQVETVMHHVLRGTGLAGLAGMPHVRPLSPAVTLVRPMLNFTRVQILGYLHDQQQTYRLDEHNIQRHFMRSRIRHELLPLLEREYYPSVRQSLLRLSRIAADAQCVIHDLAQALLDNCSMDAPSGTLRLACDPLRQAPEHVCREAFVVLWQRQGWALQEMTFEHWQRLAHLAATPGGQATIELPGALEARRQQNCLIVGKRADSRASHQPDSPPDPHGSGSL
jgi:tRNA(Ile)-lysidine synthase